MARLVFARGVFLFRNALHTPSSRVSCARLRAHVSSEFWVALSGVSGMIECPCLRSTEWIAAYTARICASCQNFFWITRHSGIGYKKCRTVVLTVCFLLYVSRCLDAPESCSVASDLCWRSLTFALSLLSATLNRLSVRHAPQAPC